MLQSFAKVRSVDQNNQYHFVRNANSHQLHPCSLLHQNPRWFKWPYKIEKQCPKDIWTLASPTVIHPLGLSHRLPPKEAKSWGASSFQLKQSLLGYLLLLERPQKRKNCVISGYTWDPNHFWAMLHPNSSQLSFNSLPVQLYGTSWLLSHTFRERTTHQRLYPDSQFIGD